MRNATIFTALVLFTFLPSGCSEDDGWSDAEKAVGLDNSVGLDKPGYDLKLKLD